MNIHVSNLSTNVIATDLKRVFAAYGDVLMAVVFRDQENSRSLGTAIIDMPNDAQAAQAILCLNNTELDGQRIMLQAIRHKGSDRRN